MNKKMFSTSCKNRVAPANTVNNAGGRAYKMEDKHALAQIALTGCFNNTFYVSAENQTQHILDLSKSVPPDFLAKLAVYARQTGLMKDTPAVLLAALAARNEPVLFHKTFPKVINNGKMIKNFAQAVRSGVTGRKSFGTSVKKDMQKWFTNRAADRLFDDSIGGDVKLSDVIKMVHPKPDSDAKNAMYGYLLDKQYAFENLPKRVQGFELFKKGETKEIPDVNFQFLTGINIPEAAWKDIVLSASWDTIRRNLNTFARHGVYSDKKIVHFIAKTLQDAELVKQSKVFPYNIYTTLNYVDNNVPQAIKLALQEALELSIQNVPTFEKTIVVCPDVSGSMGASISGNRKGATSKAICCDVAALISACFVKRNPSNSIVIPFNEAAQTRLQINPRDSVMTITNLIRRSLGGGTNISAPLAHLNKLPKAQTKDIGAVVYVSDNESWCDSHKWQANMGWFVHNHGTSMASEWEMLKRTAKDAKLVCIDLTPNRTAQALDRNDIMNIAGFSDNVFDLIRAFIAGETAGDHLVSVIEKVEL